MPRYDTKLIIRGEHRSLTERSNVSLKVRGDGASEPVVVVPDPDPFTFDSLRGAWSVARRVCADYTGSAIRIRRDSDQTERNIGFDGDGYTDTADIASWCGAASGYIATAYDQSGNGNDLSMADTNRQLRVYDGAALFTVNGRLYARNHSQVDGVARADTCGISGTAAVTMLGTQWQSNSEVAGVGDLMWGLFKHSANGDSIYYRLNDHATPWDPTAATFNASRTFVGSGENNQTWHVAAIRKAAGGLAGDVELFRSGAWLEERSSNNPSTLVDIDATGETLWCGNGSSLTGGYPRVTDFGIWEERLSDAHIDSYHATAQAEYGAA